MPFSLVVIIMAVGLGYLYTRKLQTGRRFIAAALFIMLAASFAPLSHTLIVSLESQYPKLEEFPENVHYILLLGGDFEHRGWEALRLYRLLPNAKIITSGYCGANLVSEALRGAQILESSGVDSEDIIRFDQPRDTAEEALAMRELVGEDSFILVTSAYHMPRAMQTFHAHHLHPIAAPTYFLSDEKSSAWSFFALDYLQMTHDAWHEYMGVLWNRVRSF